MILYLSTRKWHCGRTAYLHRKKAVWNRNWTQISSVTLLKEKRGWEMPSRGLQKRLFSARNCAVLSLHSRREKSWVKYFRTRWWKRLFDPMLLLLLPLEWLLEHRNYSVSRWEICLAKAVRSQAAAKSCHVSELCLCYTSRGKIFLHVEFVMFNQPLGTGRTALGNQLCQQRCSVTAVNCSSTRIGSVRGV